MAAAATAIAGCGISTYEEAKPLNDVPADIFAASTTTAPVEEETDFVLPLYFYDDELQGLVRIDRNADSSPTIQAALDALAQLPSAEELEQWPALTTKLNSELAPRAGELSGGEQQVVVASAGGLETAAPERIQRVYSQVVCSLVAGGRDVSAVQIIDELGTPIRVQGEDGIPIEGAVSPDDLNGCQTVDEPPPADGEDADDGDEDDQDGEPTSSNPG